MVKKKSDLTRLRPGFYVDAARSLYVDMKELLAASGLPDEPEIRLVILESIKVAFGEIPIHKISDDDGPLLS